MKPLTILRKIDDSELDPYQRAVLTHIWRVGHCFESVRTTATKCKMSLGKASQVRAWLLSEGWLVLTEKTGRMGLRVNLSDATEMLAEKRQMKWTFSNHVDALQKGVNGLVCVYCGDPTEVLDHWIPRSRGGMNDESNLVLSCSVCNQAKGAMTGEEFIALLLQRNWLVDDRSPDEQVQQNVHEMNGSFMSRTERSPDEQSVHHVNAILRIPLQMNLLKARRDLRR